MENRSEPVSLTAMNCSDVSSIKDLQPLGFWFWFECTSTSSMQWFNSCKLASDDLFPEITVCSPYLLLSTNPTGCTICGSTNCELEIPGITRFRTGGSEPSLCLPNPAVFSVKQPLIGSLPDVSRRKRKKWFVGCLVGGWVGGLVGWRSYQLLYTYIRS